MKLSRRSVAARAALAATLAVAALACAGSASLEVGTGTPPTPPTRVPSRPAASSLTAVEASTHLEVRFAGEDERVVAEAALALAREAVTYLAGVAGRSVGGSALLLITPSGSGGHAFNLRAATNVVLPVFYVPERRLEEMAVTWDWVHTLIHELWHVVEPRGVHRDRWLGDGLPEWVAAGFVGQRAPESLKRLWQTPPPVALQQEYPPTPWRPASLMWLKRWERLARRDPAAAIYLGQRENRRYAAAYTLVDRWLAAMAAGGSADPLGDLLKEVARHRRVDFPTANALCQRLTGRTMAQLAAYSPAEKGELARQGWEVAVADGETNLVWGLRVMAAFGVPPEGDLRQLVFKLGHRTRTPGTCLAAFDLSRVVAAWGDEEAMTALYAGFAGDENAAPSCGLAPAFWVRWAARDAALAAARVAALMSDDATDLHWQEEANRGLEQLTGRHTGWRATADGARRAAATRRWHAILTELR